MYFLKPLQVTNYTNKIKDCFATRRAGYRKSMHRQVYFSGRVILASLCQWDVLKLIYPPLLLSLKECTTATAKWNAMMLWLLEFGA